MIRLNPFHEIDTDRTNIWEMLIERDINAFLQQDWSMVSSDFITEGFMGIDGCNSKNPDDWKFRFTNLEVYKTEWLKQSASFKESDWAEDPETALYRVSNISSIEISHDSALVRKIFCGDIAKSDGKKMTFLWQTLYYCRKIAQHWKIAGFTGYLPYSPNNEANYNIASGKQLPNSAEQHKTAGPYSPILIINQKRLVVISGQAAIDMEGNVRGETIESQTIYTLDNCKNILEKADCSMEDVFKVNVFMKDLNEWTRFNDIYIKYFHSPMPVRTTVQAGLLPNLLIEIELWAAKN